MSTSTAASSTSYSAEIIGGNDDIVTEILKHLPIKPILRFKSVNKHFNKLITHPSFSLIHTLRHPNPSPTALFLPLPLPYSSSSFSLLPLYSSLFPSPPLFHPSTLVHSCNGLLLFLLTGVKDVCLLVLNPTTFLVAVVPFDGVVSDHFGQVVGCNQIPVGQGRLILADMGPGQMVVSNPTSHIGQIVVSNPGQGQGEQKRVVLSNHTTHVGQIVVSNPGQVLLSNPIITHIPIEQERRQGILSDPTNHIPIRQGQLEEQEVLSDPTTHIPIGQVHEQDHGQVVLSDPSFSIPIRQEQGQGRDQVVLSDTTTLSDTQIPLEDNDLVGLNLAFDPARWVHYYLIRVFKHVLDEGNYRFSIAVYGSNVRAWKDKVVWIDNAPFDVEFRCGVYWKGRIFWLSHTGSTVYYDVDDEFLGRLVLPKVFDEEAYLERFRYFGECCGHLHLIEIRTNCVREFDVLELDDNGEGLEWVVWFKVDLDVVGCGFEDEMFQDGVDRFGRQIRFYALSILAVIRDNEDGANDALVLSIPGKVISYSFKSRVSRLLCNVVDESDKWFPFRRGNAFQFIESLYRP